MSDDLVTVVRLDPLDDGPADRLAATLRTWLLRRGRGDAEVTAVREPFSAMGNWTPARCGHCGTGLPGDDDVAAFGLWVGGTEPLVECPACGWRAPIGDWPCPWPSAVGAPAVTLPAGVASEDLVAELRARLGGRTAVVRAHL